MKHCFTLLITLIFFMQSHAQEWVRQHPFAAFAPLQTVTFDDNGNGWAVGQQSLIMHTDDWGETWEVQRGLPIGYTFQAVAIVPGTNAQTVLAAGPGLFVTTDGGEHWAFTSVGISLSVVKRVQAFDALHWVVTGLDNGASTEDGGQTWKYFEMPMQNSYIAWFNDTQNGWAGIGPYEEYQVYGTTDGGTTWSLLDDAKYPVITDITMINNQVGFLSGRDYIYKTTNGGADWTQLHATAQASLNGMHVVNEQMIWSSVNNGFVFFTLDGGATWETKNPNVINSNSGQDIYARADGRVWYPGKYASMTYSDDFGATWSDQMPGKRNSLFEVSFIDETGFVVGTEGLILRTTNDGASWEDIGIGDETYQTLATLKEGQTSHIYIATSAETLLHSTDLGNTWDVIPTQGMTNPRSLYALSTQTLIAGSGGQIFKSTDGGSNWNTVAFPANLVAAIQFTDSQTGYATVQNGTILKTTDSGDTWNTTLERPSTYRFTGLHFNNANEGWAVAEFIDSVFKTTDAGASWTPYKLSSNTFWQDVVFMDADTGYISGGGSGSGQILRTTDGGASWETVFYEVERLNGAYVRPGADYVWVVGFGGNILHFSPCAVAPQISNLTGNQEVCEGAVATFEAESDGATVFSWMIPSDWTILGNDNSNQLEVLAGAQSGNVSLQAANSCGTTTETLSLPVNVLPTEEVTITFDGTTLTTGSGASSYQWLKDDIAIPGAQSNSYNPEASGDYTLLVTQANGCEVKSNTITVMISSTRDLLQADLRLAPNPASDVVWIMMETNASVEHISVIDQLGRVVLQQETGLRIEAGKLQQGIYRVLIQTREGYLAGSFVKL